MERMKGLYTPNGSNAVFDPRVLEACTFDDFSALTPAQKAGKIVVHTMKIQGEDFHVWSKYGDDARLIQRCMVRTDQWEAQCRQNS
jgi:hypothetical protein